MNYKDYTNSRDTTWRLLIDCNIVELPVSVTKLCQNLGIDMYYYTPNDDNDGSSTLINGVPTIFVRKNILAERQRFTAAHELGHILLGHVGKYELVNREPSSEDNPVEQAANVFASRLLAPACVLWGCNVQSADEIQQLCKISRTAAEYRMERMRILYERQKFLTSPLERQVFKQFEKFINENKF